MTTVTIIDLSDKKEYQISVVHTGENKQVCPVCSAERKNKKAKCFSFNYGKEQGYCSHCNAKFVLKKEREFIKRETVVYNRPKWKNNTELPDGVIEWFEKRRISQKTVKEFKITSGKKYLSQQGKEVNVIEFNYFRDNELINIKSRDREKNFALESGSELIFYNLDSAKNQKQVIIVEGEMDCLAMHEAGFPNCISVPNGATLSRNAELKYFDNCIDFFEQDVEFILALDNDEPGIKLRDELGRRIGYDKCYKVQFKDCKDANDCLVKYGKQGIIEALNEKTDYPIKGVFTCYDIEDDIDNFYYNGLPEGSKIGVPEFDELISFHPGYLTIVTGIPSHGKSEFVDFIMTKLAVNDKWKFGIYSPENRPLQLHFSKISEKLVGKPFSGYEKMNKLELDKSKEYFSNSMYFIKPKEDYSLDSILDTVRSLVRKHGVNAFIIDSWNKLDHKDKTGDSDAIGNQLDKIVHFCELNMVHCFLVAHPVKGYKEKGAVKFDVPTLYSINGSANFYNKADIGITVYRNFGNENQSTEVHVQKVKFKHWGKTGIVDFNWNPKNGRYHITHPDHSNWIVKDSIQPEIFISQPIQPNRLIDVEERDKDWLMNNNQTANF